MKITKIHYFFTAPNNLYWNKIGAEAEIIEGDDVRQCLYALKSQVESFYFESKASAEKQMGAQIKDIQENGITSENTKDYPNANPYSREQAIIQQINEITDLKVLESFALIAKNNPGIMEAYTTKLNSLQ